MNLDRKVLFVTIVTLFLGVQTINAAEKSAFEIANKAYQSLGSMDKYAFVATVSEDEMKDGEVVKQHKKNVSVKVDRPGSLRVDVKGDLKNRTIYIHNGVFTIVDHNEGYYGQLKASETIDGTLDFIFEKFGIRAPLASLVYSDMDKRVKFRKSKYFGKVDVAGVECDYVAFKSNVREIHAWITTGEHPKVINFTIIDIAEEGKPRTNTTIEWKDNPKISESDFIVNVPKGASKISIRPAS